MPPFQADAVDPALGRNRMALSLAVYILGHVKVGADILLRHLFYFLAEAAFSSHDN